MNPSTQRIADSFDHGAANYETFGFLQKKAAQEFEGLLPTWLKTLPEGPRLELGCGTGQVTAQVAHLLPESPFLVTDLSPEMLKQAKQNLQGFDGLTFDLQDGNQPLPPNHYSLIISALAVQWLQSPVQAIRSYGLALKPKGKLILSFLGSGSFPQWRAAAQALDLPYTANPLPLGSEVKSALEALPGTLEFKESTLDVPFPRAIDFFENFKTIGAQTSLSQSQLTGSQMRRLIRHLDKQHPQGLMVSHQVFYLCYEAPGV